MTPNADTYRALARSSPWRWRTLHFTRSGDGPAVEAWIRRPGQLVVRREGDADQYLSGVPYGTSALTISSSNAAEGNAAPRQLEADPVFRPDGLVAERPDGWHYRHGDPMFENYTWTAMLDPDELSHDVSVGVVRAEERQGRETWVARLRPDQGYDPRCGCCPLLWSEISVRAEYDGDAVRLAQFAAAGYPEAYDVGLDLQTGIVVSLEPVGGSPSDRGFSVEIHGVDEDLDDVFAGR